MAQWRTLFAAHAVASTQVDEVGRGVLTAWAEPHRRYHNIAHLEHVLLRVDELEAHAADPTAVRLAAWYHDVVYQGQPDDEENSAQRAERDLAALGLPPALIYEVARLVRMTAKHDPAPGDRNGETLSDADLAILAASPQSYADYAAAVRAEYAHLSDEAFRDGRSKVLQAMLDKPALYRTPAAHNRWTARAQVNLRAELEALRPR